MNGLAGRFETAEPSVARRDKVLRLMGRAFVADPSGALYCPDEHLLIVADLHLEKGSAYAARRIFLPPYDTAATLARLAEVISRFKPKRVVTLGDSFHDNTGAARLLAQDVQALRSMQAGRDWLWIAGNHDPAPLPHLDGDHALDLMLGPIRFCHQPGPSVPQLHMGEISGHLHPVAVVGGRAGAVRRRCFVADEVRCVLPAFGAFAGGLNFHDRAVQRLFADTEPFAHVLGRSAVFTIGRRQCLADRPSLQVVRR